MGGWGVCVHYAFGIRFGIGYRYGIRFRFRFGFWIGYRGRFGFGCRHPQSPYFSLPPLDGFRFCHAVLAGQGQGERPYSGRPCPAPRGVARGCLVDFRPER